MGIQLKIGGERNVFIEIGFTTYRYFRNKNWKPFFHGPHPVEMPGRCWFGFLGLRVEAGVNSGKGIVDCYYEDVRDTQGHRSYFTRSDRPYDAMEVDGRRYELIQTTDNAGAVTKLRDTWYEREAKLKQSTNQ